MTNSLSNLEFLLTAETMYARVQYLLDRHVTPEDIKRLNEKFTNGGLGKMWSKPEISGELTQMAKSHYFGGLDAPLPGFERIFEDPKQYKERFDEYFAKLGQMYGADTAHLKINSLLAELDGRTSKFNEELGKVAKFDADQLIKVNTIDAFGHQIWGLIIGLITGYYTNKYQTR